MSKGRERGPFELRSFYLFIFFLKLCLDKLSFAQKKKNNLFKLFIFISNTRFEGKRDAIWEEKKKKKKAEFEYKLLYLF